ncbi:aromatic acid exporter family protein [Gracilibacillus caseinilyticus]|uniref:Aromatic acid exporter family protein n=1 Tax=Gracilibacillus caseinilyticus TaxID=2932256 RepID=A0ABY4EZD1_9BACI|nr:aromatic acid exporter family protein [Gracilibacillus caseinilyticus]UOQ49765.1 aromatic acid exporter family protein [Gracilibacillus caseinilyticus]
MLNIIGYRTIKTALGAALAIFIAEQLQLDFYVSAGITAILCISVTRKDSLKASWQRIVACVIGLALATVLFELIGYNVIVLCALLLLFIPIVVYVNAKKGIVTSTVFMLHLYTLEHVTVGILLNEILLLLIGVGAALLMNTYMPSNEKQMRNIQGEIEQCFQKVWSEYARYLRENITDWSGEELIIASRKIDEGLANALKATDNHLFRHDDYFYQYFKMRESLLEIMERMLPLISTLDYTVVQSQKIAAFMEELSNAVHPGNTAIYYLKRLEELTAEFREMELPHSRREFEVRSALFHLLYEMENYLTIKKKFKPDPERNKRL